MQWIVVRDRVAEPLEATPCTRDCEEQLRLTLESRRSRGCQLNESSPDRWKAVSTNGDTHQIAIEQDAPDFPEAALVVYSFKKNAPASTEEFEPQYKATREAIQTFEGEWIEGTEQLVNPKLVDEHGRYRPRWA